MPATTDVDTLIGVMLQEFGDIAEYISDAGKVKTSARTRYYKAAFYSSVQIIELIIYLIVLKVYEVDEKVLESYLLKDTRTIVDLNSVNLGTSKELRITEMFQRPITLKEATADFQTMTNFCRKIDLIDANLLKRLRRVQSKRNEIHLQLRSSTSRSYTKSSLEHLSEITHRLTDIYFSL